MTTGGVPWKEKRAVEAARRLSSLNNPEAGKSKLGRGLEKEKKVGGKG